MKLSVKELEESTGVTAPGWAAFAVLHRGWPAHFLHAESKIPGIFGELDLGPEVTLHRLEWDLDGRP